MSSQASSAAARLDATTIATGSPTIRTLSVASVGYGGQCMPSGPMSVNGSVRSAISAPVSTSATPGALACRDRLDPEDPGVREGAAQERGVEHAGKLEVVDVAAAPGEDARVLDARDVGSDEAFHQVCSRSSAARFTPSTIDW